MSIDASRITGDLYQGSAPPIGDELAKAGFDTVVLTAVDYQPPSAFFPGIEVIRLPMADVPVRLSREQLRSISELARIIRLRLARGNRVLVTCRAGLNRSGLVVATLLAQEADMKPVDAIRLVRARRSALALNNPAFVRAVIVGPVSHQGHF